MGKVLDILDWVVFIVSVNFRFRSYELINFFCVKVIGVGVLLWGIYDIILNFYKNK